MEAAGSRAQGPNGGGPAGGARQTLSVVDGVAMLVGIVIGAGIFGLPPLVAASVADAGGATAFLAMWVVGGLVSLAGALCYAELSTAYPDPGGDYIYLMRAYGDHLPFLFAWARMTVTQTGPVVVAAFLVGQHVAAIPELNFWTRAPAVYAALLVVVLTVLNLAGLRFGKWAQNVLSTCVLSGLALVIVSGLFLADPPAPPAAAADADTAAPAPGFAGYVRAFGSALVLVLFTYGGWNETSYLSAEIRDKQRNIRRVLMYGLAVVTAVYLLVNVAFLTGLGFDGVRRSEALAVDLMRRTALGGNGARLITVLVTVAAVSLSNVSLITGARTAYALGRDYPMFGPLGRWKPGAGTPRTALLVECGIALALVLLGAWAGEGFATAVNYTLPVFWFFFLLAGVSLIVLRRRDPGAPRPFRVPLYPLTPLVFCAVCGYMLWSSLAYHGVGALAGAAVLAAGVPVMFLAVRSRRAAEPLGFEVVQPGRSAGADV